MTQPSYRTDWLCIATSGQAVDGRAIEAQWLIDAAETYTHKTYTAMIWPHHPQRDIGEREFTCNLGTVDALKVETEGDVTKLYAQLIPNQFLIDANRMEQKLFTSAEFIPDFGGSGRDYLFGLAVTDIPASLGTERLKFVLAGEEKDGERGSLETFSLGKLQMSKPDKKDSFWSRLFSASKEFTPTPEPNTDKPNEGEEQKMEELKALIQQLLDLVKSGKEAATGDADNVDTPEQAAEEVADIADEIAEAAAEVAELAQDVAENPEDEVKAAEFSVAKANLAKAMKAFNVTPSKRPRRSRRREFSARRQSGGNQMDTLTTQLTTIMTKLSAMENGGTQRPNNAPGGSNKPFEFL
ncbi:GPO family capsid scaffolding protein [Enterobacter hormaechei]|uniref:GPO family capsid scaffolding protein n=1 Tax=Enterobacter hormaechei TaxID=158836 RepID=UPI00254D4C8A|nr:GPO family capsid scaffolding protein [Enterobacter hormaechei]MDK9635060.1 GPO family capsid scaffolding protein [Enterobacter hormaechei]